MTIRERLGALNGKILTYVGDGNNVAHSLLLAGAKTGMTVRIAAPTGFEPIPQVVQRASEIAEETGGAIETLPDPQTAVKGAHVLYTDVWASMGQEGDADARALVLRPYQVNRALLELADPSAIVMHCLPAHRGQEITDEVIDGPRSVVWDQAEDRLHSQKALLLLLFDLA
jgi:ornithine carbamoyltransferase